MIYIKSVVAGLVSALAVVVRFMLLVLISTDAWLRFQVWRQQRQGSGGLGAVSVGVSETVVILLALVGFAAGFWWEFRRASR